MTACNSQKVQEVYTDQLFLLITNIPNNISNINQVSVIVEDTDIKSTRRFTKLHLDTKKRTLIIKVDNELEDKKISINTMERSIIYDSNSNSKWKKIDRNLINNHCDDIELKNFFALRKKNCFDMPHFIFPTAYAFELPKASHSCIVIFSNAWQISYK